MKKPRELSRLLFSAFAALSLIAIGTSSHAGSFTAGNIVVYRVGDGVQALSNNGNSVFIDEYTPAGTFVQAVALPTTASGGQNQLIAQGGTGSGSAIEGLITNSTNGQFVLLTGYAANLGGSTALSASTCPGTPRTVGIVKFDGTVDTSTALTDFACASNPRSATSDNGINLWVGGNVSGASYATKGSTTSTSLSSATNVRQVGIFGGQLYGAVNGSTVSTIGTGLPTTGSQTVTALTLPGAGTSPDGFLFATVSGGTVLYVTDDAAGNVHKWSLVSGTWTDNGTIAYAGARAVFGTVSGTSVKLYLRATAGTTIDTLTDGSGFNATITGTVSALITAPANEVFRGIAAAPASPATPTPTKTSTPLPGATATRTATPTPTATPTVTVTATATQTPHPTATTTPLPVAFTAGDVVVYRVGDGGLALASTGNPVYLDEYSSSGTLVQTIGLPATASGANHQLVSSGTAASEGQLTRSADGHYLLLTGYASDIPAAASLATSAAATVPRTVGRVKYDASIDTSTALTDFSDGDNPRAATSTDGTNLWVCGNSGGVRFATLGATTSLQLTTDSVNNRYVNIFGSPDQLYVSSQKLTFRVASIGGTPPPTTAPQTTTNLPGFPTTGSPDAFFLADLDSGVAGVDTLYVADDTAGIEKFSLVAGNWVANGSVGTGTDAYSGLTATVSGSTVTLYSTRKGSELVQLVDASGYNATLTGTPTLLATAAAGTAFRGVSVAPTAPPTGFVPPDKNTGKCEDSVSKNLTKLAACVRKCHLKQADTLAKAGLFDEEACETTGPKSCRTLYDTATTTLIGKAICPPCLDATAQGDLADLVLANLEAQNGSIYCAGTTPIGGDDPGFVPPDTNTNKCEDGETKILSTLAGCIDKCQVKEVDTLFKLGTFDKNACEAVGPKSCRAKFDVASGKLDIKPICPPCLDATTRGGLADTTRSFLETLQGQIYCAGTAPLP